MTSLNSRSRRSRRGFLKRSRRSICGLDPANPFAPRLLLAENFLDRTCEPAGCRRRELTLEKPVLKRRQVRQTVQRPNITQGTCKRLFWQYRNAKPCLDARDQARDAAA